MIAAKQGTQQRDREIRFCMCIRWEGENANSHTAPSISKNHGTLSQKQETQMTIVRKICFDLLVR